MGPMCIDTTINIYTSTIYVVYSYVDACKRHYKDEQNSSLEKYTSHFIWKDCVWEVSWRPNRTATFWSPLLWLSAFLSHSPWLLNWGPRGPSLSGTCSSIQHLLPTGLFSNWLNFLCTELYNSSTSTFFLWASQIALIQPIHGQGYTLLFLDRMHLVNWCISYFDSPAGS